MKIFKRVVAAIGLIVCMIGLCFHAIDIDNAHTWLELTKAVFWVVIDGIAIYVWSMCIKQGIWLWEYMFDE